MYTFTIILYLEVRRKGWKPGQVTGEKWHLKPHWQLLIYSNTSTCIQRLIINQTILAENTGYTNNCWPLFCRIGKTWLPDMQGWPNQNKSQQREHKCSLQVQLWRFIDYKLEQNQK
jgi:hypothetical protein